MFNISCKFATVWNVQVKDKMVLADVTVGKKNQDRTYTNSKYFKVKFVGKSYEMAKLMVDKDKINILSGMLGKREWEKKYYDDCVVFEIEFSDGVARNNIVTGTDLGDFETIEDDNELPF